MEKVFNLNEAFEEAYDQFLAEQEISDMENLFTSISEATIETEKTLRLVEDYFKLYGAAELNESGIVEKYKDIIPALTQFIMKDTPVDPMTDKRMGYAPVGGFEEIRAKKLSDLKFPQNIIVFIKAIVGWLKNLIATIFRAIKRAFVGLIGGQQKEGTPQVRYKKFREILKDKVESAKKLEKLGMPALDTAKSVVFQVLNVAPDAIEKVGELTEGVLFEAEDGKQDDKKGVGMRVNQAPVKVISIDLSQDLIALRQLLKHFFDLFDNAAGSSNEDLFGVSDLEMLLNIFQQTMVAVQNGTMPAYELNGTYSEIDAIDANRVKDNLINTKLNVDALRGAYSDTAAKIMNVGEIIGHKQIMMISQVGPAFKMYSSATCNELIRIVDIIEPRAKEAEARMKALENIEKEYEGIVKELTKLSQGYLAVGSITFTSMYQRKIANLLQAARYLTQTISLRIATLALYIKEMNDVSAAIENLINIAGGRPAPVQAQAQGWFARFKK